MPSGYYIDFSSTAVENPQPRIYFENIATGDKNGLMYFAMFITDENTGEIIHVLTEHYVYPPIKICPRIGVPERRDKDEKLYWRVGNMSGVPQSVYLRATGLIDYSVEEIKELLER